VPFVEGIRGPDPIRWCGCGVWRLELIGQFLKSDPEMTDLKDYVYEYSHMPICPVCKDKIRTGELVLDDATGASLAGVLG
jgi:hypothetical protein